MFPSYQSIAFKAQFTLGSLLFFLVGELQAEPEARQAFVQKYCLNCHGPDRQKADRRFDNLGELDSLEDLERWQEVVDLLNLEEMPPEDAPQPSEMSASLTEFISAEAARLADTGGHSVLRRLNAWEYRQTVGNLLGLNVEAWNPAADFPAEVLVDGFDNNGQELVTSGMLLNHYLLAAEKIIEQSTHFDERPQLKLYQQKSPFYFKGKEHSDLPHLFQAGRFKIIPETPYTDLYARHYRGGHLGFEPLARGGVPHSGTYRIRVKAAAVDRTHSYGKALADFRNGDPLVLERSGVDRMGSATSEGSVSKMHSLALEELTSEEPQWLEWEVHLDRGWEPELRFRNGTEATKRLIRLVSKRAADAEEIKEFAGMQAGSEKARGLLRAYRGPKLRVWEIQVEGPLLENEFWPPAGHQLLYQGLSLEEINLETIPKLLSAFAEKAFRRPLHEGELFPIEALVRSKIRDESLEPLAALQLGFQTILCSPSFLYLNEGEGPLSSHALASRMSYFLTSSMPDAELLQSASRGELGDRKKLAEHALRILNDPKSERFVRHFIRRWLDLDNLGSMPVSTDFVSYHRDNLEVAMRGETEALFRHILSNNLHPKEFLSADYSFLNRELAMHYGIEGIEGNHLRQVSLAKSPRGGILGHGLLQTASANGVDTSPVVRGIYVLEKLLGYSPPPPPPDVPEIESDISGASTLREQLYKHRNVASCAECHRKIDPLGFALEK